MEPTQQRRGGRRDAARGVPRGRSLRQAEVFEVYAAGGGELLNIKQRDNNRGRLNEQRGNIMRRVSLKSPVAAERCLHACRCCLGHTSMPRTSSIKF